MGFLTDPIPLFLIAVLIFLVVKEAVFWFGMLFKLRREAKTGKRSLRSIDFDRDTTY